MRPATLAIACAATASVAVLGVQGLQVVGADDQRTSAVSLAKQEMALAEDALKFTTNLEARGQLSIGLGAVPRWSRRLVEATRRSGASHAELAEAIKQHVARMERRLDVVTKQQEAAVATYGEVLDAKYEVLEAQALLLDNSI